MKPLAKNRKAKAATGGRPSRQEAERLRDRILDAAAGLFFTQGYGATSIEAVAAAAGISKRTFYSRFKDKADLFKAVVHRVVENLKPPDMTSLFAGGSCEEILRRIAPLALRAALAPQALALQRLIIAEAGRFPELARAASAEGTRENAVHRIAGLLQHEIEAGRFRLNNPLFAAEQFLQMLVSLPRRRALGLGEKMTPRELGAWARDTVDLFLHGCRRSSA